MTAVRSVENLASRLRAIDFRVDGESGANYRHGNDSLRRKQRRANFGENLLPRAPASDGHLIEIALSLLLYRTRPPASGFRTRAKSVTYYAFIRMLLSATRGLRRVRE